MDEYIKKADLKAELLRRDFYPAIVKSALETIPPADVVPRAEVKRLQSQVNRLKKYDEERDIALHARLIANTRREVAREIVEFLFRRSKSLQHLFKDNPDSAQCFRGRFELENAAVIIANEYGVDLKKKHTEKKGTTDEK